MSEKIVALREKALREKERKIAESKVEDKMEEYCFWCANDMLEKSLVNDFPPCEVCGKVFDLKIFNSCSKSCSLNCFENFKVENVFNCSSCNDKVCLCDCRWLHFNDKESCKCESCINEYDETLCLKCNKST